MRSGCSGGGMLSLKLFGTVTLGGWPGGRDILEQVRRTYRSYVVMRPEEAVDLTLFVAHTHCHEAAHYTPYVCVTAPTMRTAKTLVLDVSEALVCRPISASSISAAALYRAVEAFRPTLLLDEQDAGTVGESLRRIINSGYKQSGRVIVVERGIPAAFRTFCPKMFAGIGLLPSTVVDRSIVIRLKRALPEEPQRIRRFDAPEHFHESEPVRTALEDFGLQYSHRLARARPRFADLRSSRAQDIWAPLW